MPDEEMCDEMLPELLTVERSKIKTANIVGYGKEAADYDDRAAYDVGFEVERTRQLLKSAAFPSEVLCVLEIGGGTGEGTAILRQIVPDAFHVISDISLEMLEACRQKFPDVPLVVCDAEFLPFRAEAFHVVACASFLHHLPDDEPACEAVARVLRPGGAFVGIREPNMAGTDRGFRWKHLPRRYGDREGLITLLRRLSRGPRGWREVFSYEIPHDELVRLDLQEIRGAILCPTPTKQKGGIDVRGFCCAAREHFDTVTIHPFALCSLLPEVWAILLQDRQRSRFFRRWLASTRFVDALIAAVLPRAPFDSFSFLCRKKS